MKHLLYYIVHSNIKLLTNNYAFIIPKRNHILDIEFTTNLDHIKKCAL